MLMLLPAPHQGSNTDSRIRSSKQTWRRCLLAVCALAVLAVWNSPLPALAADTNNAAIAQDFNAGNAVNSMVAGSLVSTNRNTSSIELASLDNADRVVGVVASDPLVTLSNGSNPISVVINGKADVLVSDINGSIEAGDRITASPIAGIGMKATSDSQIIGTAQASQKTSGKATNRSVKDIKGTEHTVNINRIPVQIGVAFYQQPGSNFLPPFVQRLANSIAGRPVSLIRVLLSSCILIAALGGMIAILYAATRNAMTALGRNPLASSLVYKGLYRIIAIALGVMAVGLLASYLLLRF